MSSANFVVAIIAIEVGVITIGSIGNLLSIIVFSKKTFRNNSISTYCIALAIADCLSIIQLINSVFYFQYNAYLMDLNDVFCKISSYATVLVSAIPPYIMVAFSIDKILSMRTSSIAIIKKKWFQWSVVAGIVLFHVGLYMYHPIFVKRLEYFNVYFCDITSIGFVEVHIILLILETCIIPFVILMVTSILTIRMLLKSRNSIERNGKLTNERKSRDRKYAISSVTLNIVFIVLKLPLAILFFLYAFFNYYDDYFYNIANFLFYLNTSLGFFIHIMTNSLFRREFLLLFRSVKNQSSVQPIISTRQVRTNRASSS
jgi:hypothetical protein